MSKTFIVESPRNFINVRVMTTFEFIHFEDLRLYLNGISNVISVAYSYATTKHIIHNKRS